MAASTRRPKHDVPLAQSNVYRLILFNGVGTRVLLHHERDKYSLPEIQVRQFSRSVEQITSLVRQVWSLPAVMLFSIGPDRERRHYAVLEVVTDSQQISSGLHWVPVQSAKSYLNDNADLATVEMSQTRATQVCAGMDAAPFSRIGHFRKLQNWIRMAVSTHSRLEKDNFVQLNGSEAFTLFRFESTGKALWFKAVGKPNTHEFTITLALSTLFPDFLPKILASNCPLNGWLMESAGEATLCSIDDFNSWRNAVCRLAALQIQSIPHTSRLSEAGCRDLRLEVLRVAVNPFCEAMAGLMEQQTKNPPPPLTRRQVADVESAIIGALQQMSDIAIPYTLGHGDFNPGNILVEGDRCVFIDWAEAHVSHPFLTFEYLLAHLRVSCQTLVMCENALREAYAQCWQSTLCSECIERSFRLSPLIAMYASAISNNSWRDPERLADPQVAGYLRSLTRRMKEETCKLH